MNSDKAKTVRRMRRKKRIRKRVSGTADRPRMSVFRSDKHIYVQLIDDASGSTLCQASTRDKALRESISYGGNRTAANTIGEEVAKKALAQGIKEVLFDRNGFAYHGRIKAVADAARKCGIKL